jgi:hypothetical protein
MPRQNVIFSIVTPLVLMAIIAAIVITIGESLLAIHEWASELYHVGSWPTEEENRHWAERAALYPVFTALGLATLILIGGALASRLAPQRPRQRHD